MCNIIVTSEAAKEEQKQPAPALQNSASQQNNEFAEQLYTPSALRDSPTVKLLNQPQLSDNIIVINSH